MLTQDKTIKSLLLCIMAAQCCHIIAIDNDHIIPLSEIHAEKHGAVTESNGTATKTTSEDKKKDETKLDKAIKIVYLVGAVLYSCNQAKHLFWSKNAQPVDIPSQLYAARKKISELIAKNANGAIGRYGLPMACDAEIKKLVFIPGGPDLLKELRQLFESYVDEAKKRDVKLPTK